MVEKKQNFTVAADRSCVFRYFFCRGAEVYSHHTWQGVLASGGGKGS